MIKKQSARWTLLGVFGVLVLSFFWLDFGRFLSFESLKAHHVLIQETANSRPLMTTAAFLVIYVVSTALSLPGALVLTLAAGATFGLYTGVVLVSFASTLGATLAFLASRFLFQSFVQRRFSERLREIHKGMRQDGAFYLFTLRMLPVFPFFLVNLLMGLTSLRTRTFFWVSQIGMLPGTIVYVNAGTRLAELESLEGLFSMEMILSFALIGLLPLISRRVIRFVRSRRFLRRYRKPSRFDYNLVVIGGGSAGLVTAYVGAAVKAKVALIEKHKMGGDCLNTGCVPSKALIRSAKMMNELRRTQDFGIEVGTTKVDFARVMERVSQVIQRIAPHDSVERYQGLGVECLIGEARIRSPYEVEVNGRVLTTKSIVVATGASPLVPAIPGLSEVSYLTSDNLWSRKELPRRLVVLGGGPIGCELAQSFARFGSEVTLVEMGEHLLGKEDQDVSTLIAEKFRSEGIKVLTGNRAVRVHADQKTLVCDDDGTEVFLPFDEVLVALGRKANVSGFGLEELGVEISEQGRVVADEFLRTTNYPNIYVCGDVTSPYQFTHTASQQAGSVAINALLSPFWKSKADHRVIPWCTFTDPEVARVGLSEREAREQDVAFRVSRYEIDDLDRAIVDGDDHGFVKVLTAEGSDRILGVTIVGHRAGEIIAEYVMAMKYGLGLNQVLGTIHIYPTLTEANKFAAGVWRRETAPQKVLSWLEKFHRWRRS